jgi:hypothetical protein
LHSDDPKDPSEHDTSIWELTRYFSIAYYIAFGAHGPRAATPPGEAWKVLGYTGIGVAVSFVIFVLVRMGSNGPASTMTKEYQEKTNEYLKVCNALFLAQFIELGGHG